MTDSKSLRSSSKAFDLVKFLERRLIAFEDLLALVELTKQRILRFEIHASNEYGGQLVAASSHCLECIHFDSIVLRARLTDHVLEKKQLSNPTECFKKVEIVVMKIEEDKN